jgi:hypothetical protein
MSVNELWISGTNKDHTCKHENRNYNMKHTYGGQVAWVSCIDCDSTVKKYNYYEPGMMEIRYDVGILFKRLEDLQEQVNSFTSVRT